MVAALVVLTALAAGGQAGSADAEPVATGKSAARAQTAERCRATARQRLVRIRRGSLATGARKAARKRVRRKLVRCLRAARAKPEPAQPPGVGGPTAPASPVAPAPADPGVPQAPAPPSFVSVTASDSDGFRLTLSRPAVAAGNVTVELRNIDSGPHDLWIEPDTGGPAVAELDEAEPGAVVREQVALARGKWLLYCSLPGHAAGGMRATLRAE